MAATLEILAIVAPISASIFAGVFAILRSNAGRKELWEVKTEIESNVERLETRLDNTAAKVDLHQVRDTSQYRIDRLETQAREDASKIWSAIETCQRRGADALSQTDKQVTMIRDTVGTLRTEISLIQAALIRIEKRLE